VCFFVVISGAIFTHLTWGQQRPGPAPVIPKTWDDAAMATLEVPLANPIGSPKHVFSGYYYKIPVRPIYKSYPFYAPGHEPPGYIDWLKQQDPVIVWDDKGHAPPLNTPEDWIRAGEIVFEAPILLHPISEVAPSGREQTYQEMNIPVAANGTVPTSRYVITKKGQVMVASQACSMCHTRVMPNGSILKGAQGKLPFDPGYAYLLHGGLPVVQVRLQERFLFAVPWVPGDWASNLDRLSTDDIASLHEGIPNGVIARQGTSPFYPVQVPDLIGVKDRRYLDHTGLEQQRSIADLMRYAALNQGGEFLASYDGFIPAGSTDFKKLPDPASMGRYSDAQLYALALYLYSLKPPPNPNKFDTSAAHGKKIFAREGCPACHTPPLYTNNKLTLAEGFTPSPDADEKYDILPISLGTDPGLALKTRRGTGYYKVPSLKGVWYRSMFGHSGWCATLEDWFDRRRLQDNYVPTGFKPHGTEAYAVKGHPFGLELNAEDKKALLAFLKTL